MGCLACLALWIASSQGVAWSANYDAAFAEARRRAVPVFLAFNMDGEGASDWTARSLYRDPSFVERTRDFVCLIGSVARHDVVEEEDAGGVTRRVCSRFGSVTCEEHRKVEIKASDAFVGTDWVVSPQHVLVSPDGKVLARKAYRVSKEELFRLMSMAERAMAGKGGGVRDPDLVRIEELKKKASDRNAATRTPAIWALGAMPRVEAREVLMKLLATSRMDSVRMDVLDALATKGNYDALPCVLARLRDRNNMVVKHAIVALEKMALPDAVPPLMKLWKRRPKSTVAREIPRALAKCAPGDEEVRKIVRRAATGRDPMVALSGLVALADLGPDPDVLGILMSKLGDASANVRGVAVWALGKLRAKDAAASLEAMREKETHDYVKQCLEAALRNIQSDGGQDDPDLDFLVSWLAMDDVYR